MAPARRTDWSLRLMSPEEATRWLPHLTAAMSACLEFRWVTGADDGRPGSGERLASYVDWMLSYDVLLAARAGGECVGAYDRSWDAGASPAACSISFPPGAAHGDRAIARGIIADIGMPPPWREGGGWDAGVKARHRAMARVAGEIRDRAVGGRPHWYLNILGTAPAAQGTGAGAALVARLSRLAAADGAPLYLETTGASNPPWYQRRGMRVAERAALDAGNGEVFDAYGGFHAMVTDPPPAPRL